MGLSSLPFFDHLFSGRLASELKDVAGSRTRDNHIKVCTLSTRNLHRRKQRWPLHVAQHTLRDFVTLHETFSRWLYLWEAVSVILAISGSCSTISSVTVRDQACKEYHYHLFIQKCILLIAPPSSTGGNLELSTCDLPHRLAHFLMKTVSLC